MRLISLVALCLGLFASLPARAQSIALPNGIVGDGVSFVDLSGFGTTPAISGFSGTTRVIVNVSAGAVRITSTSGLTAPTGYSTSDWANGAAEIGFEGSQADINTALATLAFRGGNATLTIDAVPGGNAYNPATGSYYEYVSSPLLWSAAKTDAETRSLNGAAGYLATVTTQAELNFLLAKVGVGTQVWLGGTDSAVENNWRWVNSPGVPAAERDALFFTDNSIADDAADFWCSGEPNDSGGNEDALQINASGCWNDLPHNSGSSLGYIVEYTPVSGVGSAQEVRSVTAETVAPVLTISSADPALAPSASTTLTFTFSEDPVGFAVGDVTVTGGTLSGFTVTGNPQIYTATLTAGTGATVDVLVADGAFTDAVGNAGIGDSLSLSGSPAVLAAQQATTLIGVIKGSVNRSVNATLTANRRMLRDARTRFMLTRRAAVSGSVAQDQIVQPLNIDGEATFEGGILSTKGRFFGMHPLRDGNRLVFGDFYLQADEDGSLQAALNAQTAFERQQTPTTLLGYFIGANLDTAQIDGTFAGRQAQIGASVGGYFVSAVGDALYVDGFAALGAGLNDLSISDGTLDITSRYTTISATAGFGLTGVVRRERFEFWPELALSLGRTWIGDVDYTGAAYGLVDDTLVLNAGAVSVATLTLRPEIRVPMGNTGGVTQMVTFAPRLICEHVAADVATDDCGAGAEVGLTRNAGAGHRFLSARVSVDDIGGSTRGAIEMQMERRF